MAFRVYLFTLLLIPTLLVAQPTELPPSIRESFRALEAGALIDEANPEQVALLQLYYAFKAPIREGLSNGNVFHPFSIQANQLTERLSLRPQEKASNLLQMNVQAGEQQFRVRELGSLENMMKNYMETIGANEDRIGDQYHERSTLVIEDSTGRILGTIELQNKTVALDGKLKFSFRIFSPEYFHAIEESLPELVKIYDQRHGVSHSSYQLNEDGKLKLNPGDFFMSQDREKLRPLAADAKVTIKSQEVDPRAIILPPQKKGTVAAFAQKLTESTSPNDRAIAARLMYSKAIPVEQDKLNSWVKNPSSPQDLRLESLHALTAHAADKYRKGNKEPFSDLLSTLNDLDFYDQQAFIRYYMDESKSSSPSVDRANALSLFSEHAARLPAATLGQLKHTELRDQNAFEMLNAKYSALAYKAMNGLIPYADDFDKAFNELDAYVNGVEKLGFHEKGSETPQWTKVWKIEEFRQNIRFLRTMRMLMSQYRLRDAKYSAQRFPEFLAMKMRDKNFALFSKADIFHFLSEKYDPIAKEMHTRLRNELSYDHLLDLSSYGKYTFEQHPGFRSMEPITYPQQAGDMMFEQPRLVAAITEAFEGPGYKSLPADSQLVLHFAAENLEKELRSNNDPKWKMTHKILATKLESHRRSLLEARDAPRELGGATTCFGELLRR